MKRVLSLVLALVLVLGTIVPAFAEDAAAEKTAGEILKGYGVIEGTDEGLQEDQTLTRAELAVVLARLNGKAEDAQKFPFDAPDKYTDLDNDAWYAKWVAYAIAQEWMGGTSDTTWAPDAVVSAQMINTVVVEALGYTTEWNTVNEQAAELMVAVDAKDAAEALRGELFTAVVKALDVDVKDAEMTLGSKLALTGYEPPAPPAPTALEIEKFEAINGRQVVVTFNQEVDKATLVAANLKVYRGAATTAEAWTYSLSEDKKVVTLAVGNEVQQDTVVKLVAEKVKNVAKDMELAKVELTSTMKDTTAPAILSAEFTTSKTIKITTSEPLELTAAEGNLHVMTRVLIDDKKLVGKLTADNAKNTITVTLGSKLAVGEHTIKVTGLRDYANWLAPDFTQVATIVEDKTAPEITAVEAGRDKVKVTFNEELDSMGTITINGVAYTAGTTTDNMTYTITLTAGNELGLAYLVAGELSYYGARDMEGNVKGTSAAPAKFAFTAVDETVAPTADITVDANNNIIITFSEAMSVPGKVLVEKADGTDLAKDLVPAVKNATKFQYQVSAADAKLNKLTTAGSYTITLTAAKDASVRQNAIASTVVGINTADVVKPTIANAVLTQTQTTDATTETRPVQVTVYFSEAMDVASITDANNYMFAKTGSNPVNLSSVANVSLAAAADAKSVVITIPGTKASAGASTSSKIYGLLVKDAAGNTLETTDAVAGTTPFAFNEAITIAAAAASFDLAAIGGTAAYAAEEVAMVAPNQIKVGFTNPVNILDPSEFVIYKTGTTTSVQLVGVSYTLSADNKVATITLNGSMTSDAKVDSAAATFYLKAGNTKDVFGNAITATTMLEGSATANASAVQPVTDYVKPSIKTVRIKANTGAGHDIVVLTFDENVTASDLALVETDLKLMVGSSQLALADYSVANVANTIEITISKVIDSKVTVQLLNGRYITDGTNTANVFDAMTVKNAAGTADYVVDTTVPTESIPAATGTDNNATTLVVTVSEALYVGGTAVADAADLVANFTNAGTGTVSSAIYDVDTLTITLTLASSTDADVITFNFDQYTDMEGNVAVDETYTYTAAGTIWAE